MKETKPWGRNPASDSLKSWIVKILRDHRNDLIQSLYLQTRTSEAQSAKVLPWQAWADTPASRLSLRTLEHCLLPRYVGGLSQLTARFKPRVSSSEKRAGEQHLPHRAAAGIRGEATPQSPVGLQAVFVALGLLWPHVIFPQRMSRCHKALLKGLRRLSVPFGLNPHPFTGHPLSVCFLFQWHGHSSHVQEFSLFQPKWPWPMCL